MRKMRRGKVEVEKAKVLGFILVAHNQWKMEIDTLRGEQ